MSVGIFQALRPAPNFFVQQGKQLCWVTQAIVLPHFSPMCRSQAVYFHFNRFCFWHPTQFVTFLASGIPIGPPAKAAAYIVPCCLLHGPNPDWGFLHSAPCCLDHWLRLLTSCPCCLDHWLSLLTACPCCLYHWLRLFTACPCCLDHWLNLLIVCPCCLDHWLRLLTACPCCLVQALTEKCVLELLFLPCSFSLLMCCLWVALQQPYSSIILILLYY